MASKSNFFIRDLTMQNKGFYAHIALSRFHPRFKQAQLWLDQTIMSLMHPRIPYKTGEFLGKILNANAGNYGTGMLKVAMPPQGRFLYGGITKTGKPINYTNPLSVPHWGEVVVRENRAMLTKGVRDIIRGK